MVPVCAVPWAGWSDSAIGTGNQVRVASGSAGFVTVSIFTGRIMPMRVSGRFDSGADGIDARSIPPRVPLTDLRGETVQSIPDGTRAVVKDAGMANARLFVLPADERLRSRVLDVYDSSSSRYLASIRLPIPLDVLGNGED